MIGRHGVHTALLIACSLAVFWAEVLTAANQTTKIPPEQLDALVAPIALYPDALLAQTLAASTYPLEIVQLQQWLQKNPGLKNQALADAVAKQPWDPSVQALAALPDLVKRLCDDIQWTTDLGNAFLAQQVEVMDAVQRMRRKAQDKGNLQSTTQQKVATQVVEQKEVIVIEQADPQVVYVPSYNPVIVYGPPVYPYPPIYYPPPVYYPGGMAISFSIGVAMGAFWGGGAGWGCGWNNNTVIINNNNRFNHVSHYDAGRGNTWRHNPQHRGGTPYADRATAERFSGAARGDSVANRQANARREIDRQGGQLASHGSGAAHGNARSNSPDRIGTQDVARGGGGNQGVFDGGTRGYDGPQTRAASSRGAHSMGSRGGASRGGGRRR